MELSITFFLSLYYENKKRIYPRSYVVADSLHNQNVFIYNDAHRLNNSGDMSWDALCALKLFFDMQTIKINNMSSAEYQAYKEKCRKRQES